MSLTIAVGVAEGVVEAFLRKAVKADLQGCVYSVRKLTDVAAHAGSGSPGVARAAASSASVSDRSSTSGAARPGRIVQLGAHAPQEQFVDLRHAGAGFLAVRAYGISTTRSRAIACTARYASPARSSG